MLPWQETSLSIFIASARPDGRLAALSCCGSCDQHVWPSQELGPDLKWTRQEDHREQHDHPALSPNTWILVWTWVWELGQGPGPGPGPGSDLGLDLDLYLGLDLDLERHPDLDLVLDLRLYLGLNLSLDLHLDLELDLDLDLDLGLDLGLDLRLDFHLDLDLVLDLGLDLGPDLHLDLEHRPGCGGGGGWNVMLWAGQSYALIGLSSQSGRALCADPRAAVPASSLTTTP